MFAGVVRGEAKGVTDSIDYGAYQIPWTGTKVMAGDAIPGAGSWEIVEHAGCDGNGTLCALARGARTPLCPRCGAAVQWQLTHLAPTVAADHKGIGHLP
jgi:hypothetical protein